MSVFTASNGVMVIPHDTSIGVRLSIRDENPAQVAGYTLIASETYLDPRQVDAMREFHDVAAAEKWQAARDTELNRWRYPLNSDYVVYRSDERIAVVNERVGFAVTYTRDTAPNWESIHAEESFVVAVAYFEAHPEQKPWEDAEPGEVWALGMGGGYHCDSISVIETEEGIRFIWGVSGGQIRNIAVTDRTIDYGKRVFPPEEAS